MATRIAMSQLNASTVDIVNTIRANASYQYQQNVPEITQATEIPKVGDVLYGYPALANEFVNALVNRIALVVVKAATFNNAYAELKKGYLEYGETVEEVFVSITKAREFSADKADAREHKRSLPDVRTAFHVMNWKVQYPITIQDQELRQAFLSVEGVQDLIAKIIAAVYTAAEYDEYLLFKYLLIKGLTKGKMYPVHVTKDDINDSAVKFRAMSNQLTFMSNKYNASGVTTSTPKKDQYIFMDSTFNAKYDVNVLAGAFNMEKADFIGKLKLIDDWATFDNDRFSEIVENSDMIEPVTQDELENLKHVVAVLVDKEWFQVYDYQNKFTEKYVAAGDYWNYFFNVWKSVSWSPFSNAVVFNTKGDYTDVQTETPVALKDISVGETHTIYTFEVNPGANQSVGQLANYEFVEVESNAAKGIAFTKYGVYIVPNECTDFMVNAKCIGQTEYNTSYDFVVTTADAKVGNTYWLEP